MTPRDFINFVMEATLDDLGRLVATQEIESEEVSAHGCAMGSALATCDCGAWVDAFSGVVSNDGLSRGDAQEALAIARSIGAMYAADRGSAADSDAAARLAWRVVGGGRWTEWEMRTSAAVWAIGPAGIALWDGTYEGGEPRVWVAGWGDALNRLRDACAADAAAWTDDRTTEVEGDDE